MSTTRRPTNALKDAFRTANRAVGATLLISAFANLAMLAAPLYSIQVNDRVLASKNMDTLAVLTLIVVVFLVLYGILDYVRSAIQARAGLTFDTILRGPLFEAAMKRERLGQTGLGPQALRDAESIRDGIASPLVPALCDVPWVPVYVLLAFYMHLLLGLVALVGAGIVIGSTVFAEAVSKASVARASRLSAEGTALAAAAFKNIEAVGGLGMGEAILRRWSATQAEMAHSSSAHGEMSGAIVAISKLARQLVQILLIGVGAYLVIRQEITPGIMMASSLIMGRALAPVEQVVAQWRRIVAIRAAVKRVDDIMKAYPVEADPIALPRPDGRIDLEDVYVLPPGTAAPTIKGLSLTIAEGQSVAVVGTSGSGKSTLARVLAGVWRPRSGAVRIDGTDYGQWNADRLGRHIGYLPQTVALFRGTVAENIARLGAVDDAAVIAAAQTAGAHEEIIRLPKGYDTQIGDDGSVLSGGMRQRIGLARALYGDPTLVVLDEPDASLDEAGERSLSAALHKMTEAGRTVVVVTHRPQLLAQVNNILVLSHGQKVTYGPRHEVIAQMRGNTRPTVVAVAAS